MHNVQERTRVIEHTKYDSTGKVIGTFGVTTITNETDKEIYLTREWCENAIRKAPDHIDSFTWRNHTGKKAYYESGDKLLEIKGYDYTKDGDFGVMTLITTEDNKVKLEMSL